MFLDLEINSTKKFSDFLEEHPNFYDSVIGFAFDDDTHKWQQTAIDPILVDLIFEQFYDRYICDDDKFERLFRQRLNTTALRWANYRRIELSAFDPLVADYVEREIKGNNNVTTIGNSDRHGAGSNTRDTNNTGTTIGTRTPNLMEHDTNVFTPGVKRKDTEIITPGIKRTYQDTETPYGTKKVTKTHNPDANYAEMTEDVAYNDNKFGLSVVEQLERGETWRQEIGGQVQKSGAKNAPMSIEYQGSAGAGPNIGSDAQHDGGGNYNGNMRMLPEYNWNSLTQQQQQEAINNSREHTMDDRGKVETQTRNPKQKKYFVGKDKHEEEESYLNNYRKISKHEDLTVSGVDKNEKTSEVLSGNDNTVNTKRTQGNEINEEIDTNIGHASEVSSNTASEIHNDVRSGFDQRREVMTGRGGMTPPEAFSKAIAYLKTNSAWDWIESKLDPLFMRVTYEPD